ncbi:MAG: G-D-S-L family lipolytic protein, partial [Bacteroidetes bacterium]|nr:G-D-S-L family lipolytic protein [Bacteroidota bacterium]
MQKISIHIKKYIPYVLGVALLVSCEQDAIEGPEPAAPLPALSAGSLDLSTYVALGASITAGFTDGAIFKASQQFSWPNLLAQKFAKAGGGSFSQPMMNDNNGGLLLAGNMIAGPRLFFNGAGPASILSVNPGALPTTDIATNNPSGPFNNMAVPGAKSFHLLAPGYGNIAGVPVGLANPYFTRMASSAGASVLGDAMAQQPTFFSLWIGANDVLGYAVSGGDGRDPITPISGPPGVGFDGTYGALIATLTAGGAKGIVANIPYVTSAPHFTTVPHNPIPLDAATAGAVNAAYAPYNGGLQAAYQALQGTGLLSAEEVAKRTISFSAGAGNAVVIVDESLTDLGAINPAFAALPKYRQATAEDLLVLPASTFIGTLAVPGNPLTVNGVAVPLADKWVLTPQEQAEIKTATDGYNNIIKAAATAAGLAHYDANTSLQKLASVGITDGKFTLTSNLVTGGAFSLDGIHPNSRGSAMISNLIMKTLDA